MQLQTKNAQQLNLPSACQYEWSNIQGELVRRVVLPNGYITAWYRDKTYSSILREHGVLIVNS